MKEMRENRENRFRRENEFFTSTTRDGGIPLYFFQAAAFIILAYKDAGHDIDAELAECDQRQSAVSSLASLPLPY